ncbi:hypothetical protein GCM10009775_32960 [Microbacterium aoyamense]|uniref:Secreted protein n=1 Tax=Microbacterium aoyamense TaxID=344166 RepID=A0ABN2PY47_9MICO
MVWAVPGVTAVVAVMNPRPRTAVSLMATFLRGLVAGVRVIHRVTFASVGRHGVVMCVVVVLAHAELPSTVRIRQMRVRPGKNAGHFGGGDRRTPWWVPIARR